MSAQPDPRPNRRALGTDKESQVVRCYLDGYSIAAVAKMHGIGDGTVYRILDRHQVPRRMAGIPAPRAADGSPTTPGARGRGNAEADRLDDEDETLTPDDLAPHYARTIGRHSVRVEVWVGDDGMGQPRLFLRPSSTGRPEGFPVDATRAWALRILTMLDTLGAEDCGVSLRGRGARI